MRSRGPEWRPRTSSSSSISTADPTMPPTLGPPSAEERKKPRETLFYNTQSLYRELDRAIENDQLEKAREIKRRIDDLK